MSTLNGTMVVCGGAGFIGSNFVRYMLGRHKNLRIINFDKLTYAGNLANLKDIDTARYVFIKGDIANPKHVNALMKKYKPEYVVNFAAETHVDRSVHGHAADFVKTNVGGVFTLLEAMKTHLGLKKFVQVSTDEVYGDVPLGSRMKFFETSELKPSSPYASTKAAGDLLCLSYFRTYQVPVVITRGSNTYGPNQFPEKIIPLFIKRLMRNQKVPVYGDGRNTRDWLYVEDHARGIETVLQHGKSGEIYNISAEEYHTNIDLTRRMLRALGKNNSFIAFVNDRPGHDRKYVPSSKKIRSLGWKPNAVFHQALLETISWYKNNL